MKSVEWWRGTANHMWRTYFALKRSGFNWDKLSRPDQRIYAVCHHLYEKRFVKSDQAILEMYFTTRWGDDQYAVEDYSLKHNVPVRVIWMVVKRANRIVMEQCGFLETKEGEDDDKI